MVPVLFSALITDLNIDISVFRESSLSIFWHLNNLSIYDYISSSIYSKQIFSINNELISMIKYQKWEGIQFVWHYKQLWIVRGT